MTPKTVMPMVIQSLTDDGACIAFVFERVFVKVLDDVVFVLFVKFCFLLFNSNNLLHFEVKEFLLEMGLVLFSVFFFEIILSVNKVFVFINFFFFKVIVLDLVAALEVYSNVRRMLDSNASCSVSRNSMAKYSNFEEVLYIYTRPIIIPKCS